MAAPWSAEYELEYARTVTDAELQARYQEHAQLFGLAEFCAAQPLTDDARIVEVGCGRMGGLLSVYPGPGLRIAVDPLVGDYWGDAPPSFLAEVHAAYAHELPLADASAQVVFCVETLDHCDDMQQFARSQAELVRILAPGGTLFFMLPPRDGRRQHNGHPCNPDEALVAAEFQRLGCRVQRRGHRHEGVWLQLEKPASP